MHDIDRREFLTRAALGAAALGLSCARASATGAASEPGAMFVSLPPWAVARNVGWPEPCGETQAKIDHAALLAGEGHGANHKEDVAALKSIHKVHDLLVFAADASIEGNLGEVAGSGSLRVLHAGDVDTGFHGEVADLY